MIVTNRIVATLTGVAMAMLFALIPPQSRGGDLEPMFSLLSLVETAFKKGMLLILEEGGGSGEGGEAEGNGHTKDLVEELELESLSKEFMSNYLESKSKIEVEVLLTDASKLNGAPLLRVDKRLMQALKALTVTAVYVETWLGCAQFLVDSDDIKLSQEQRKVFDDELRWLVQRGEDEECVEVGERREAATGLDREEADLLLHSARFINYKLKLLRTQSAAIMLICSSLPEEKHVSKRENMLCLIQLSPNSKRTIHIIPSMGG